jgi:hypothetical protein
MYPRKVKENETQKCYSHIHNTHIIWELRPNIRNQYRSLFKHFFICLIYIIPNYSLEFIHIKFSDIIFFTVLFIHSFIHLWLYSPLLGPGLFFSSVINFTQTLGFLWRVISQSQRCYLHTGHHKHRINADKHPCLEWDSNPRFQRSSERGPRVQCDRHNCQSTNSIMLQNWYHNSACLCQLICCEYNSSQRTCLPKNICVDNV